MAKDEGAYTPPSIASIFSDSEMNSRILANNSQLVAMDLPFKFLSYSEPNLKMAHIAYTSADFIVKRHDLPDSLLTDFSNRQNSILSNFDKATISETNLDAITKGFDIVKIKSDHDFQQTVSNLKELLLVFQERLYLGRLIIKKMPNPLMSK